MDYDLVGKTLDLFRRKKRDFQLTYGSPSGQRVLAHLAHFCKANDNAAVPGNKHLTWVLIGRREVWLLIQKQLNLTSEELFALQKGQTVKRLAQQQEGSDDVE